MTAALQKHLKNSPSTELYRAIVLGINSDELTIWAKEVVSEKATIVKREMQLKQQKKSKGLMNRFFGNKEQQTEEQKEFDYKQIEREINEHADKITAIKGNSIDRANIPDISLAFMLDQTSFTLVNNMEEYKGVTLQTQELKVFINQYDGENKYNKKTIDVDLSLQRYGIWVNYMDEVNKEIDFSPFMQRITQGSAQEMIPRQPNESG